MVDAQINSTQQINLFDTYEDAMVFPLKDGGDITRYQSSRNTVWLAGGEPDRQRRVKC